MEGNKSKVNINDDHCVGVNESENEGAKVVSISFPPQLQQQLSSSTANGGASTTTLHSNGGQTIYIPPKVDADRYQAEIPDILPTRPLKSAIDDFAVLSAKTASSLSLDDDKREKAAIEFLQLLRNFTEPLRPASIDTSSSTSNSTATVGENSAISVTNTDSNGLNGSASNISIIRSSFWTLREVSAISLESDAAALEFLQEMNYNVDAAWFSLCIHMCRGKDWVCTHRALSFIDRLSPNMVFSECKDRVLRLNDRIHPLLGDVTERERDRDRDRDSRLQSVANSLFLFSEHLDDNASSTPVVTSEPVADTSKAGPKADDHNADKESGVALPAAGYNKPSRVANNDKLEARKKWASILARANAMLDGQPQHSTASDISVVHSTSSSVSASRAPGKGTGTVNGSKSKTSTAAVPNVKPPIEDVQSLLDEAVSMTHQIVTLSNNKSDEELADSLRSILGELLRAMFSAREWVAEVRDALYNYSVNGILGEEETTVSRRKARKGRDYNAITTTRDAETNNNGASNNSSNSSSGNNSSASSSLVNAASNSNIIGDNSASESAQATTIDAEEDECNNFAFFRKLLQKGEALFLQTKEETLLRDAINKAEAIKSQLSAIPHLCVQYECNLLQCLKKLHFLLSDWRCNENHPPASSNETLNVSFLQTYSSIANCSDWTLLGLFSIPVAQPLALLSLERSHLAHNALEIEQQVSKLFQSGAPDTHVTKERPNLQEVCDLLQAARVNPLKLGDISYISAWCALGEAISGRMLFFLVKAKQYRAGSRQRGQGPFIFEQVQNLLRLAQSFPIELPSEQELEAYLTNVENWKFQVKTLGCLDPSQTPAKTSGADSRKRGSAKQESGPQTVPLRVVETLLVEGERLPFDLREDLDSLREKKLQAKAWLDRLKKSFVSVKVGTNRLRNYASQQGTADGEDSTVLSLQNVTYAQADRLTLTEMKNLLLEGETLYQQPTEEQQSILAENPSSSKVVARSRDLDRAQAVVENAEEWISRVKDVLTASSERDEDEQNESKDEDDADTETKSNRSQYRSASMLRVLMNLLDEANSMPVAMEEAQALRLHLQALQWATRLSPKLIAAFQNHKHIIDSSASKKDGDDGMEVLVDAAHPATQTAQKIKLSELQLAAKEIAKIRSSLSETSFGKEIAVIKALPEEEWVVQLLSVSEKWLSKVKRLFANNVLKPGMTLSRLRQFYTEGNSMPIDFEQYLNPIGAAIEAADNWLATHRQQLQSVCIHVSANIGSNSASAEPTESVAVKLLDYYELSKLHNQSTSLVAEIEETKMLKQKLDEVKHVIDVVETLTSRRTPGVEIELIMFKEVEDIYRKVDAFPLDLEDEKTALISLMKAAVLWETRTRNYFLTSFMEEIKSLFTSYSAIAAVNFFSIKIDPISPLVDEESLALAGANTSDLDLYSKLTMLVDSIVELKVEGQQIGVEMNATSVVCAYRDIIELMRESRNILRLHAENSTASEELSNSQLQYWGDVDDVDVGRMLKDIYLLLSMLGRSDVQALSGGLNGALVIAHGNEVQLSEFSEEDKGVISAILQSSTVIVPEKEAPVQRKRKSSEPKDLVQVKASLSTSVTDPIESEASEPQSQPNLEEKTIEAKVTRGSVGIVKRKVSDAFIEQSTPTAKSASSSKAGKSRLSVGESTTSAVPGVTQSGSKRGKPSGGGGGARKRQKNENGASTITTKGAPDTDDKVKAEDNSGDDQDGNATHSRDKDLSESKKSAAAESAQKQLRQTLFENIEKVKNMGHHLPDSLEGLLVLWARCLEVFRYRLRHHAAEFQSIAQVVLQKAQLLATGAAPVGAASLTSQVDQLLNIADRYNIQSSSRTALENLKNQVKIWSEKALSACRTESTDSATLLNLDDLKQLLKEGERLPFADEISIYLLAQLKQEVKAARQWIQKLSRAGIGAGVMEASSAEGAGVAPPVFDASSVAARSELVTSLLAEAQTISVDLTQYTDQLTQMCTTYCLCRHLYHGQMIGCDTCEDWYHLHCVGISVNQAEKCDKYLCPRCLLRNSFQHSACVAAQVTHKWENMGDQHFKARQNALLKVNKKIFREETQANKMDSYLKGLKKAVSIKVAEGGMDLTDPLLQKLAEGSGIESIAVEEEGTMEQDSKRASLGGDANASANSSASLGVSNDVFSDEFVRQLPQWRTTLKELESCRSSLKRSVSEREFLQKAISLECKHAGRISQWMGRMQRVLWPNYFNDGDALAGAPIAFWAPKPDDPKEALQQLIPLTDADALLDFLRRKDSDLQFDQLLPAGMHKYAQDARSTGCSSSEAEGDGSGSSDISNIEDVQLVLDAFRWMSWCSISLNLLRCPPTTVGLRRMMESAGQLRLSDDKVVKLLSSISTRACSWKSRVRKFLALPAKGDFSQKLAAFRDEGFHMPISSRLMANLRAMSDKIENSNVASPMAVAAVKEESMDVGNAGLSASNRRVKGKGSASAGFSSDVAAKVLKSVAFDNSSDEDAPTNQSSDYAGDEDVDGTAQVARSLGVSLTGGASSGGMKVAGIRYSKEQLAAPPKLTWPPLLPLSLAPSLAATGLAVSSSAGGTGGHHYQLSVAQGGAISDTASSAAMEEDVLPFSNSAQAEVTADTEGDITAVSDSVFVTCDGSAH